MNLYDRKPVFYFQADANAIGGLLQTPESKPIPAQATVSLPAVGGYVSAQTGAFNFDHVVSVTSTYVRVAGRIVDNDGGVSTLVTSVVEGLNILEVVTADRIVAQLAIEAPPLARNKQGRLVMPRRRISLAGSRFEGLRIAGMDATPQYNGRLLQSKRKEERAPVPQNTWQTFQEVGVTQAARLQEGIEDKYNRSLAWLKDRYHWMVDNKLEQELALCSLVDEIAHSGPGTALGHVVDIPDFGRIFLGELLVSPVSVQLTMIRAELGCNVNGALAVAQSHSNGTTVPPGRPL